MKSPLTVTSLASSPRGWSGLWWSLPLLLVLALMACAPASVPASPKPAPPTATVLQAVKATMLGRALGPGKPFESVEANPETLGTLVGAARALLAQRPGRYVPMTAFVATNASVALDNPDPNYHQLLARWGRQTGWRVVFDREGDMGDGSLLRAAVLLSRYNEANGAHEAYQYVITRQDPSARLTPLAARQEATSPWDEAMLVYSESDAGNGVVLGTFTLIFRSQRVIGFVSNIGVAGAVTHLDTADLTQAVIDHLDGLTMAARP